MSKVVSNPGPFIHLAQIGKLKAFSIFPNICVPTKIISEIIIGDEPGIKEISSWSNVQIFRINDNEIREFQKSVKKFNLEIGEIHALCLYSKIKATLFLTDDLDARTAGLKLGFKVHGTVGIIAKAFHTGLINLKEAEQGIAALYYKSSLFVTKGIVTNAIKKLKESATSR